MTLQNPETAPASPSPTPRRSRMDLKILGIVVLVVAAFAAGALLRGRDVGHADHAAAAPVAAEGEAVTYTCSMHPEIRNPGPGKCPICGMDLIPVSAEDDDQDADPRRLSLSPSAAALLQVQTFPVQRRDMPHQLRLFGRVDFDQTTLRRLTAWTEGRLEELFVDFCCVTVEAGSPLVLMYSPTLIAAQAEFLEASRALRELPENVSESVREAAAANLRAARDRLRLLGLFEEQISQIEDEGVQDQVTILAPAGGTVTERHVLEGMYVQTGDPLFTIADLSQVWVNLEAYETDVAWLEVGQSVDVRIQAFPGEIFRGDITFMDREIEEGRRTLRVRVTLPNEDERLTPGMFATAEVQARLDDRPTATLAQETTATAGPLVIPASAALITGRRAVVYVQVENADRPTFEGRQVTLGPRSGDWYTVRDGLSEGELVVTNGNFRLDAELQLRGRVSMMSPEGGAPAGHDHAAMTGAAGTQEGMEVPPAFAEQVGEVVKANFTLVTALADDDPAQARSAAEAARGAIAEVEMSLLSGAAHDIWMSSQRRMDRALEQLAAEPELDPQRRHFETFSDELTRVVRRFGTGNVGPVYRALCPMVEGRDGYWLQSWEEITNPYWGEAMYSCGNIEETLVEARDEQ